MTKFMVQTVSGTLSFLLYVLILSYLLFWKCLLIFKYTYRPNPKFPNLLGESSFVDYFFYKQISLPYNLIINIYKTGMYNKKLRVCYKKGWFLGKKLSKKKHNLPCLSCIDITKCQIAVILQVFPKWCYTMNAVIL